MNQYFHLPEIILLPEMYNSFLLNSSHNSQSVDFTLSSIKYQNYIMIRLRRKSPFPTRRLAPSCPWSCAFDTNHFQCILQQRPFLMEDIGSWKSYYTTGIPKFTMADNHCKRFKATHNISKIRVHSETQHLYFTPQEDT